jgi:hypothetical protein
VAQAWGVAIGSASSLRRLVFFALNAKDGKERWRKKIADEKRQYFTTMAPW